MEPLSPDELAKRLKQQDDALAELSAELSAAYGRPTVEIHDTKALLKYLEGNLGDLKGWIFRGVSDAAHKLQTKVGWVRKNRTHPRIDPDEERKAVMEFRNRARPYVSTSIDSDLEWMILGRHHGLPTRLLDWSSSPLVAAFFAVEDVQHPRPGAMYAVPRPPLATPAQLADPFGILDVRMIEPPHITDRIPRQSSLLTIHGHPHDVWKPSDAHVFLFPPKSSMEIVKYGLDDLGINHGSLFPGLDGVAGQIGWQMKRNRLVRR
jgi:hypothetical protein